MPEWKGRFQEWNERRSSILPYQHHAIFRALFTEKYVRMLSSDKQYWHRSIQLQYLHILFVDKIWYFGGVYCALHHSVRITS